MWIPESIEINNLGSHKRTDYPYLNNEVRIITGENLDDSAQKKNGSGKSLVPEACYIALIGEPLRKIRLVDLIRDGEEYFEITLILNNPLLKKRLKVMRKVGFKAHEVSIFYIKEGGEEEPIKASGNTETTKRIQEILGITKEDILNYFIVQKNKFTPFFSCTDTKQKEIIARFSGGDLISDIDKTINAEVESCRVEIIEIDKKIAQNKGKIEVHQERILEIQSKDLEKERTDSIAKIETNISEIQVGIDDLESNIIKQTQEIVELKSKIRIHEEVLKTTNSEIEDIDFTELENDLKAIENSALDTQAEKKEINELRAKIDKNLSKYRVNKAKNAALLAGKITCPSCAHVFILDSDEEYSVIAERQKELEETIEEINTDLENVDNNLEEINSEIEEIDVLKDKVSAKMSSLKTIKAALEDKKYMSSSLLNKINSTIDTNNSKINSAKDSINSKKSNIKDLLESIEVLKLKELKPDPVEPILLEITNLEQIITNLTADKKVIDKEIVQANESIELFKRFKNYLSNQIIKSIEGYTNFYLDKFGSNLNVLIEGQRLLADGKSIRDEIECSILKDGYKQGPYGRYSSGERARIDIASILSLKKLINLNTKSGGFALLNLDEAIESIDSEGISGIFEALQSTQEMIEVVTFAENNILGIDKVTFRKQNGESIMIRE